MRKWGSLERISKIPSSKPEDAINPPRPDFYLHRMEDWRCDDSCFQGPVALMGRLQNLGKSQFSLVNRSTKNVKDLTGFECPTLEQFEAKYLKSYHPHARQRELRDQINRRYVVVVAGRRSGKTFGCGREFLRRIYRDVQAKKATGRTWSRPAKFGIKDKGFCEYWCTSPTYQLGGLQRQEIFETLGGDQSELILAYRPGDNQLWLRGGVKITFKSGERPMSLVGAGLDGLWDDESARQKAALWEDNLSPTLADKQGWALFSTTPLGTNWFYREIWQKTQHGSDRDNDFYGVHFTTAENTALPHLVEEARKAKLRLNRATYLRNYEASFHAFEGKIFEDFLDDEMHIVNSLPVLVNRWGGLDWGHDNPGSQIALGSDRFGNVFAYKEDYERRLTIAPPPKNPRADCWVNRLQREKKKGLQHWWADPSLPSNIQTCNDHDLRVFGADNAVSPGIDFVSTLLRPVAPAHSLKAPPRPTLYIHKSCTNLRTEMSGYKWGTNGKPVKENDHALDSLRYGLFTESKRGTFLQAHVKKLQQDFPSLYGHAA